MKTLQFPLYFSQMAVALIDSSTPLVIVCQVSQGAVPTGNDHVQIVQLTVFLERAQEFFSFLVAPRALTELAAQVFHCESINSLHSWNAFLQLPQNTTIGQDTTRNNFTIAFRATAIFAIIVVLERFHSLKESGGRLPSYTNRNSFERANATDALLQATHKLLHILVVGVGKQVGTRHQGNIQCDATWKPQKQPCQRTQRRVCETTPQMQVELLKTRAGVVVTALLLLFAHNAQHSIHQEPKAFVIARQFAHGQSFTQA
mmetsp:Transcript_22766/g.63302  ORF Transcript_22766/g.63302 Transcript_22766/m.63302 type:complete len:259 (+) Transcript_22766:552-1328(+)